MRKMGIAALLTVVLVFLGAGILKGQGQDSARNLGPVVNSPDSDFGPIISADGLKLLFTSDRAGGFGGQDIWISEKGADGNWSQPKNMGPQVNSDGNEGPDSLSVDNKTVYFTRCKPDPQHPELKGTCDIWVATLDEGMNTWANVSKLSNVVNSDWNDVNSSISFDGKTLYFVSDRLVPGSKRRNWDIYRTRWDDRKQEWLEAERLGEPINTPGNEFHVQIHQNNVNLFFSSDGHGGFGGADIFMSTIDEGGNFAAPQNLGPQINTKDNDMYFNLPAAGDLAYLASNRSTTECRTDCQAGDPSCSCMEDIYAVPFSIDFPMVGVVIIKGVVADKNTCTEKSTDPATGMIVYNIKSCTPINGALIRLADVMTDQAIKEDKTGPTGSYQVAIPAGKDYSIMATAPKYSFHTERFNVPKSAKYQIIEKNILLVSGYATFVVNNLYFDFDKATLRPESKNELNNAIRFLLENPSYHIEVGGHTDSKGSDTYNQKLSLARAKSVYDYLVREGHIDPARLTYFGYGERMPIASNATDEGRQLNRRVEFKITQM